MFEIKVGQDGAEVCGLLTFLWKSDAVAGLGRLPLTDAVDGADAELVGGGRLQRRKQVPTSVAGHVRHFGGPRVDRVRNGTRYRNDTFLDDELGDGAVAVESGNPRHVDHFARAGTSGRYADRRVRQFDDVQLGLAAVVATRRSHVTRVRTHVRSPRLRNLKRAVRKHLNPLALSRIDEPVK